jgi:hypothetical protein
MGGRTTHRTLPPKEHLFKMGLTNSKTNKSHTSYATVRLELIYNFIIWAVILWNKATTIMPLQAKSCTSFEV